MFPMYRGKRQSKLHHTQNRLVLGPRRRRRDVAPHEGEANAEKVPPVLINEEQIMDEEDSYEAPAVPSKPTAATKKTSEPVVAAAPAEKVENENKVVNKKPEQIEEPKVEVEKSMNPPTVTAEVQAQEHASIEYVQNPIFNNFILPLTRTTVNGVNYYNMSVSLQQNKKQKVQFQYK